MGGRSSGRRMSSGEMQRLQEVAREALHTDTESGKRNVNGTYNTNLVWYHGTDVAVGNGISAHHYLGFVHGVCTASGSVRSYHQEGWIHSSDSKHFDDGVVCG